MCEYFLVFFIEEKMERAVFGWDGILAGTMAWRQGSWGNGGGWRWVGRGEESELYAWGALEICINAVEGRKGSGWYTSIVGVS